MISLFFQLRRGNNVNSSFIRSLFQMLTRGCDHHLACFNPLCRSNPTSSYVFHDLRTNDTEIVAQGLHVIGEWSRSGRCHNLRSLQILECCVDPQSIRNVIWQHQPVLYWPCQEFPIGHLIYDSGSQHIHGQQQQQQPMSKDTMFHGCYRPMRLRQDQPHEISTGIEIIPKRVFRSSSPVTLECHGMITISFFFQVHPSKHESSSLSIDTGTVLLGTTCGSPMVSEIQPRVLGF